MKSARQTEQKVATVETTLEERREYLKNIKDRILPTYEALKQWVSRETRTKTTAATATARRIRTYNNADKNKRNDSSSSISNSNCNKKTEKKKKKKERKQSPQWEVQQMRTPMRLSLILIGDLQSDESSRRYTERPCHPQEASQI